MENQNYYEKFKALTEKKVVNFEMFSTAGNKACAGLVKKITRKICGNKKLSLEELTEYIKSGMKKISKKHGEVYDSEPPYHIAWYTNKCLEAEGYSFKVDSYDICF
jgi:hypothetical protein